AGGPARPAPVAPPTPPPRPPYSLYGSCMASLSFFRGCREPRDPAARQRSSSRTAGSRGCRVAATHRSRAVPDAPHRKPGQLFRPRGAARLRLGDDRDPCTGHRRPPAPRPPAAPAPAHPATPAPRPGRCPPALGAGPATAGCPPPSGTEKRNPSDYASDGRHRPACSLALPKTRLRERLALTPQVVPCARQPRRQERQHAPLVPLLELLLLPLLGPLAGSEEQAGRLGERPAQVGVADLLPSGADQLARRFRPRPHQPAVGEEWSLAADTLDGMDLIKQHQGAHLAHPRNRLQPLVGLHVIHLGGPRQVQLQVGNLLLQTVDHG